MTILEPGTRAPEFSLASTPDQRVSLGDFRGKFVVLAFDSADWIPVCGDQMALYNEMLGEFRKQKVQLLGVSVDGVWCHGAFANDHRCLERIKNDFNGSLPS